MTGVITGSVGASGGVREVGGAEVESHSYLVYNGRKMEAHHVPHRYV
jgi:hypothetical protein